MLWAGKLIHHVMSSSDLANSSVGRCSPQMFSAVRDDITNPTVDYFLRYGVHVVYFVISKLKDCGNWRYDNTTKPSARELETDECNNLTQN